MLVAGVKRHQTVFPIVVSQLGACSPASLVALAVAIPVWAYHRAHARGSREVVVRDAGRAVPSAVLTLMLEEQVLEVVVTLTPESAPEYRRAFGNELSLNSPAVDGHGSVGLSGLSAWPSPSSRSSSRGPDSLAFAEFDEGRPR